MKGEKEMLKPGYRVSVVKVWALLHATEMLLIFSVRLGNVGVSTI